MDMEGGPGCLIFFTAAPMDSEGGPDRMLADDAVKDAAAQGCAGQLCNLYSVIAPDLILLVKALQY